MQNSELRNSMFLALWLIETIFILAESTWQMFIQVLAVKK